MNGPDYGKSDIKAVLRKKKKTAEKYRIYESQHSSKLANNDENLCVPHAN